MKKRIKWISLLLILILSMTLTSCSYDSERPQLCVHEFKQEVCVNCGLDAVKLYTTDTFSNIFVPTYNYGSNETPIARQLPIYVGRTNYIYGKIILPDRLVGKTVVKVENKGFKNYNYITEVIFPDSIKVIGKSAFEGCEMLESVTLGKGLVRIERDAFLYCDALRDVYVTDLEGWLRLDFANEYCSYLNYSAAVHFLDEAGKEITDLTIPSGVTSIPDYAFRGAVNIKSVTIPDGVTEIGNDAFAGCNGLESVTLGKGVTKIGDRAFAECPSLYVINNRSDLPLESGSDSFGEIAKNAKILIGNDDNEYILIDGFLFKVLDGEYQLFAYVGNDESVTLPESVNGASYKIYRLSGAKNVTVPKGVTHIDNEAFSGSESLISVTLPDTVKSIGSYAFFGCKNLSSVTLGSGVEHIGNYAFAYTKISEITLPLSIKSIGDGAFYDCNELSAIDIPAGVNKIGYGIFASCDSMEKILIQKENTEYYSEGNSIIHKATRTLIAGCNKSTIPEGGEAIGRNAFTGLSKIEAVVIPDSVKEIGTSAFEGCTSLRLVEMGEGVAHIGDWAFANCRRLEEITVGSEVAYIGEFAFFGCLRLKNAAFENCEGWQAAEAEEIKNISQDDLADTAKAAELLTEAYVGYTWRRAD